MAEDSRVTEGRAALDAGVAEYNKDKQNISSMSEKLAIAKKGIEDLGELISNNRKSQKSYRDQQADAKIAINQYLNQINQLNHASDSDENIHSKQSRINDLYNRISSEQNKIAAAQREIDELERKIDKYKEKKKSATELAKRFAEYIRMIKSSARNCAKEIGSHIDKVEGVARSMEEQAKGLSDIRNRDIFGSSMAGNKSGWRSQKAKEANDLANSLRNIVSQLRKLADDDDGEDEVLSGIKRSHSLEK